MLHIIVSYHLFVLLLCVHIYYVFACSPNNAIELFEVIVVSRCVFLSMPVFVAKDFVLARFAKRWTSSVGPSIPLCASDACT